MPVCAACGHDLQQVSWGGLPSSLLGAVCAPLFPAGSVVASSVPVPAIPSCVYFDPPAPSCPRVEVNEELDLEVVIRQLKRENALLRQELALLRSGGADGGSRGDGAAADAAQGGSGLEQRTELTEAEQHVLRRQVQAFVEDPSPDALLGVEPSMLFIQAAFDLLKGMARGAAPGGPVDGPAPARVAAAAGAAAEVELHSLRQVVQRQEQQIKVLSGVLRKQGVGSMGTDANTPSDPTSRPMSSSSTRSSGSGSGSAAAGWQGLSPQQQAQQQQQVQRPSSSVAAPPPAVPYSDALLADQHKAVSTEGSA